MHALTHRLQILSKIRAQLPVRRRVLPDQSNPVGHWRQKMPLEQS